MIYNLATNHESNIDSYRTGYRNALADIVDIVREYSDTEEFLNDLAQHLKDKDLGLDNLTGLNEFISISKYFHILVFV